MTVEYPTVEYPTIVEGQVYSDLLRLESLDGSEMYVKASEVGCTWGRGFFHLKNVGPLKLYGKWWGVPHLQKQSKFGWLLTNPHCLHSWYWFKKQEQYIDQNGVLMWKPGSERGIYFRKPFSWRWDVAGTMIDGTLRHWIRTRGYLGGHWD